MTVIIIFFNCINFIFSAEQEAINLQSMKVSEMGHYVKTTLKKTTKTKQELEFHLCACEAAINAFSLKFDALQSVETSSLLGSQRSDCLDYILRNMGESLM